jgi:hypothetical protein
MPRVDDQPTDATPVEDAGAADASAEEAAADADTTAEEAAGDAPSGEPRDEPPAAVPNGSASGAEPVGPAEPVEEVGSADASAPVVETRASRRARREAAPGTSLLPSLAHVNRPLAVVATILLAALLVLGVVTDPVLLAAALAAAGLLLAWGWPRLLGSSSRFGSSLAIGVTAVLTAAATAVTAEQPYLRLVPVALAVGLGMMFGHQLLRRDGRPRLTESAGVTAFGLALVALGSTWMPLSRSWRTTDLAVAALVAVAVSALADLLAAFPAARAWMLPAAMVLGAAGAVVAASVLGSPGPGAAALTGLLAAGVSHALRRALMVLPPVGSLPAQLAVAAAALLAPGVVAYGLSLVLVG